MPAGRDSLCREVSVTNKPEIFAVGDHVVFNQLGKNAQVSIPAPDGRDAWTVKGFTRVESPPAPHPQLVDLGEGYAIGPVSGMFLTRKNGAAS